MGRKALAAVRITREGLMYLASADSQGALQLAADVAAAKANGKSIPKQSDGPAISPTDSLPADAAAAAAGPGNTTRNTTITAGTSNRKLLHVISPDTRTEVVQAVPWPFTAVGRIDGSGCSGAMYSRRAVLTAGHCLHSGPGGPGWFGGITFSPARSCDSWCWLRGPTNPYGTLGWSWMTTYYGWANNGDWRYDIGVIHLNQNIGERTGWFGLTWSPFGFSGLMTTAGYPSDKRWGTLWRTYFWASKPTNGKLFYSNDWDLWYGQSGSAAWMGDNVIRAVVSHSLCSPDSPKDECHRPSTGLVNGMVQIDQEHFNNLLSWM